MASNQLQKPTNNACSHAHEEHKFSYKISEVTAWGSRVFGHKQQENQAVTKHCTTCQCSAPKKDTKPACTDMSKKEHAATPPVKEIKPTACTEGKKKGKEEHTNTVNKDAKHHIFPGMKKEKQHTTNTEAACVAIKKEKEHNAKSNTANACNTMIKKEHKGEPANHCFSTMADHWKDKIMMMKKTKDVKSKDSSSSSSSSSDSEDETCEKKKKGKRHYQGTKTTSK